MFRVPPNGWAATNNGGKGCFFFQTDPFQQNIFDMTLLPHTIAGGQAGRQIKTLYKERFSNPGQEELTVESPALLACSTTP